VELYLHSPSTPSWRGAQGSTGTTLLTYIVVRNCLHQIKATNLWGLILFTYPFTSFAVNKCVSLEYGDKIVMPVWFTRYFDVVTPSTDRCRQRNSSIDIYMFMYIYILYFSCRYKFGDIKLDSFSSV
jgi:hypothetical protein